MKMDKEKATKFQRKNSLTIRVVYLWNALAEVKVTAPNGKYIQKLVGQRTKTKCRKNDPL